MSPMARAFVRSVDLSGLQEVSPLAVQPERAFHHLDAGPADMRGSNGAALLADAGQQQARPSHVDALPDAQFKLGILFAGQVDEQRRGCRSGATGSGVLGKA